MTMKTKKKKNKNKHAEKHHDADDRESEIISVFGFCGSASRCQPATRAILLHAWMSLLRVKQAGLLFVLAN